MFDRLSIEQAGQELGLEDARSIKKWLKDNGVKLYPKESGQHRYVYTAEFNKAFHAKLLYNLKKEFGEKAFEAYEAYKRNDTLALIQLKQESKTGARKIHIDRPKGQIANEFLEKLKNKTQKFLS